ncbi:hypothetical protein [Stappia sp.]|uniref:hypothetical protein n=1 Tax=Stappia sp. TaxID=1870903 RepID=UPI003C7EA026
MSRKTDPNIVVVCALLLAFLGLALNAVLATAECSDGEAWGVCFREWLNATGVWVASAAALLIGWWHFGPLYQQASIEHGRDLAVQRGMLARIQRDCISLEARLLDQARIVANPGRHEPPRMSDQKQTDAFLHRSFSRFCTSLRELTFDCIEQWTVLEVPIAGSDVLEPLRSDIVKRLASLDTKICRVRERYQPFRVAHNDDGSTSAEFVQFQTAHADPTTRRACQALENEIEEFQGVVRDLRERADQLRTASN